MASILVIDDDDDLREMISCILELQGHAVRTGRNGQEGLHGLDEAFPQLVVSDLDMPILDGPAMIYRMFVENLGRENIPVVVVSGSTRLVDVADALGTPYFLAKPFRANALLGVVDRALVEAIPPRPAMERLPI